MVSMNIVNLKKFVKFIPKLKAIQKQWEFEINHSIWEIKRRKIGAICSKDRCRTIREMRIYEIENNLFDLSWRENKSCWRRLLASKHNGNRLEACHNFHSSVKKDGIKGRKGRDQTCGCEGGDRYERAIKTGNYRMRGRKKMMAAFECKNHIGRDDRYSTGDLFIWPRGHLNASEYFREDTPDDWIYSRACGSLARSFKAWLTPVFSTLLGKRELGHVRISNDPPLILRLFPFLSFSSLPLTAHVSNFTLYAFKWKNYNQFIFSNGTCFFF